MPDKDLSIRRWILAPNEDVDSPSLAAGYTQYENTQSVGDTRVFTNRGEPYKVSSQHWMRTYLTTTSQRGSEVRSTLLSLARRGSCVDCVSYDQIRFFRLHLDTKHFDALTGFSISLDERPLSMSIITKLITRYSTENTTEKDPIFFD